MKGIERIGREPHWKHTAESSVPRVPLSTDARLLFFFLWLLSLSLERELVHVASFFSRDDAANPRRRRIPGTRISNETEGNWSRRRSARVHVNQNSRFFQREETLQRTMRGERNRVFEEDLADRDWNGVDGVKTQTREREKVPFPRSGMKNASPRWTWTERGEKKRNRVAGEKRSDRDHRTRGRGNEASTQRQQQQQQQQSARIGTRESGKVGK